MKKIVILFLILAFVFVGFTSASADELEELRREQEAIQKQIDDEQAVLRETQQHLSSLSGQVKYLEDQITLVEKELASLEKNLKSAEELCEEAEAELREVEEALEERVDLFKKRLVQIYQNGDVNIFEVMTQSTSFTDFLVRFELLKKVAEQDMKMVEEIDQQRLFAEEKKAELDKTRDYVVLLKKQSEKKMIQLASQKSDQQVLLDNVRYEKSTIEKALAELERDSELLGDRIRELQISRARGGLTAPTGTFQWPTPGYTRVTSDYGMRTHPILRVQSMHTGVDIAAPMGSKAVAGELGEVIYTGWFGGYGWTVVVYHGGGISSMYPHLSKISVKEGQIVVRGEEVGLVGTSGLSTGPHIHFEVREDGDPVSPWPYLR